MQVTYGMICTNDACKEQYQVKCEYDELADIIAGANCTSCGEPLRRNYSVGAIKFNGTGWAGTKRMI